MTYERINNLDTPLDTSVYRLNGSATHSVADKTLTWRRGVFSGFDKLFPVDSDSCEIVVDIKFDTIASSNFCFLGPGITLSPWSDNNGFRLRPFDTTPTLTCGQGTTGFDEGQIVASRVFPIEAGRVYRMAARAKREGAHRYYEFLVDGEVVQKGRTTITGLMNPYWHIYSDQAVMSRLEVNNHDKLVIPGRSCVSLAPAAHSQPQRPLPRRSVVVHDVVKANHERWGGHAEFSGVVTEMGARVAREVRLHERNTSTPVRYGWSDDQGNYSFSGLNPDLEYYAVAFDHNEVFNMEGRDRIRFKGGDEDWTDVMLYLRCIPGDALQDYGIHKTGVNGVAAFERFEDLSQGWKPGPESVLTFDGVDFSDGDFCIEFTATATGAQGYVVSSDGVDIWFDSGVLKARVNTDVVTTIAPDLSTAKHICVDAEDGEARVFVGGVRVGSVTLTEPVGLGSQPMLGARALQDIFTGVLSNIRVTRASRYATDFTPASTPYPIFGG